MSDGKKQELQQKYMQFQMIQEQLKQGQQQLKLFEEQLHELANTKDALTNLKTTEAGTEILVPMSSGIFIKAKLDDNEKVNINVGANVAVQKNVEDAKKLIEEQESEIRNVQLQLINQFQQVQKKAESLESEMQNLVQEVK